jgi:hypothetical protein
MSSEQSKTMTRGRLAVREMDEAALIHTARVCLDELARRAEKGDRDGND